ncbi:hypothetical protein OPV22_026777 [Ensete ventricosum]|uniref:Uncharacterized protein n=1 Tax=Ensete ventricosum TaxID=4639 RepID=A0AAV8Q5Y5_ENSVE|nr:hypothetical protein OPV22_026777 [Ensete ventricosum]
MCGNAIISDFIPTPASRRMTAEHLWPGKPKRGKHLMVEVEEEGKADFEEDEFDAMWDQNPLFSETLDGSLRPRCQISRQFLLPLYLMVMNLNYSMISACGRKWSVIILKRQSAEESAAAKLSEELSAYKPYMKFLPEPCFEGSLDASIDSLFGDKLVQDAVDLWSFDDLPTRSSLRDSDLRYCRSRKEQCKIFFMILGINIAEGYAELETVGRYTEFIVI